MSDDLETLTIDGRVHTYLTNAFVDEAERMIAALVEKAAARPWSTPWNSTLHPA